MSRKNSRAAVTSKTETPDRPEKPTRTKLMPSTTKLSALAAAALVLQEAGQAMTCGELIHAMADKGLWSSPNGQTPAGTIHAAIMREINTKKEQSRFVKAERGKFAWAATA